MSADVLPFQPRPAKADPGLDRAQSIATEANWLACLDAVEQNFVPFVIEGDNGNLYLAFEIIAEIPPAWALTAAMVMRDRFQIDEAFRSWVVDGAGATGTYRPAISRVRPA